MKRRLVIVMLLLISAGAFAKTGADSTSRPIFRPDRMFSVDKGHHFAVSAMIFGLSFYALRQELNASNSVAVQASVGVALSFGIGKELYDSFSGRSGVSWLDLVADVAGIALAGFLLSLPLQ